MKREASALVPGFFYATFAAHFIQKIKAWVYNVEL